MRAVNEALKIAQQVTGYELKGYRIVKSKTCRDPHLKSETET